MAQRSAWRGAIQFGGFPIYVAAYTRLRSKSADSFKNLCPCHKEPVAAPKTCATTGQVLSPDVLLKGVEVARGDVREVPVDAVEALRDADRTDMVEMQQLPHFDSVRRFLDLSDKHYRLIPDEKVKGSEQPVQILWNGLHAAQRAMVTEIVLRSGSRPALIAVVATVYGLDMHSLPYADDIVETPEFKPVVNEQAAQMFEQFASMQGINMDDFAPGRFPDTYRERRDELVQAALAGEPIKTPAKAAAAPAVPDLMAAMAAALETKAPAKKSRAKAKAAA